MEQTLSPQISNFLTLLEQAQKEFVWSQQEVVRLEQLTQDYLHMLELQTSNYHERAKVAAAIRHCRINRRLHKDNATILAPLVNFIESEKGKVIISQLQQTLGAVRKAERYVQDRRYNPRVMSPEDYENKHLVS